MNLISKNVLLMQKRIISNNAKNQASTMKEEKIDTLLKEKNLKMPKMNCLIAFRQLITTLIRK